MTNGLCPKGYAFFFSNYSGIRQSDWETRMSDLNQIRRVAESALFQDIYLETAV